MKSFLPRGLLIAALLAAFSNTQAQSPHPHHHDQPSPHAAPQQHNVSPAQKAALTFAGLDGHHTRLQRLATDAWGKYEKRIGTPLTAWSGREIGYPGGSTVFYPFSGPDFLTVARMFPGAERYVLVAIQNARPPVQPDRMPPDLRQKFDTKLGMAWERFGALGFFRTEDLDDDQRDTTTRLGVTTILMAFAARMGYEVLAVEPLEFSPEKGKWMPSREGKWRSVRLLLRKDERQTTLDYIRLDLSNGGLQATREKEEWIRQMAHQPTLLKAASHLLQERHFSILRDALVQQAPIIVQDETGLDYADLRKIGGVTLYGNFREHNTKGTGCRLQACQRHPTRSVRLQLPQGSRVAFAADCTARRAGAPASHSGPEKAATRLLNRPASSTNRACPASSNTSTRAFFLSASSATP